MVFLRYRWMGHDYWGYWCNDCTLYFYKRIHFIINYEICKLSTLPLITFVVIFGTLIAFYLCLDSIRYLTPKETTLFGCTEPLRDYYFFCTYIARAISIFSVIRRFLCHCNGAHLKPKPDEGNKN